LPDRIILLVDMDYFFVACEELRNPAVRETAAIVGADPKNGEGRGVVSTCNYIARKRGVHSGMPISSAYRIMPDALFLPVDMEYYERKSAEAMGIIKRFAEKREQVGIDEIYLEVQVSAEGYAGAERLAKQIKEAVAAGAGLPCSVGVSVNKMVAKAACESAKPNGIQVVTEEDAREFLSGMPVGSLHGIGKKTEERLKRIGYSKVGEVAAASKMLLIKEFGAYGAEMHDAANGIDRSGIVERWKVKSISREETFIKDTSDPDVVRESIIRLSHDVHCSAATDGVAFKTVGIKIRYWDFSEVTRSISLHYHSNEEEAIRMSALHLLDANMSRSTAIRKVGVRVSNLTDFSGQKKIANFVKALG